MPNTPPNNSSCSNNSQGTGSGRQSQSQGQGQSQNTNRPSITGDTTLLSSMGLSDQQQMYLNTDLTSQVYEFATPSHPQSITIINRKGQTSKWDNIRNIDDVSDHDLYFHFSEIRKSKLFTSNKSLLNQLNRRRQKLKPLYEPNCTRKPRSKKLKFVK